MIQPSAPFEHVPDILNAQQLAEVLGISEPERIKFSTAKTFQPSGLASAC